MPLLPFETALELALSGLCPLGAERVPLSQARGRVLAEDLAATLTQPPFDASAMDGYAVRAADVAALPATLALIGESAAGARFGGIVEPGQAVRIFTGAPIPDGADTVVIQEDADTLGSSVVVKDAIAGRHIRPRGQDFLQGDVLLTAGTRLGARALLLAAAMNHAELPVRRKPKVATLSTGDEVVRPGSALGPDQIVASVGYGIAALVEAHGGEPIDLGIAPDDADAIATAIEGSVGADILVTIGGASVGERDLVTDALARAGLQLDFCKVAIRPGKPVFSGRLVSGNGSETKTRKVLGLPGNPVSALVCSVVILLPMLRALLGQVGEDTARDAVLEAPLAKNGPRQSYLRATSTFSADGKRHVQALPSQDSSLMAALAKADCLIVQAPDAPALPQGASVKILLLPA